MLTILLLHTIYNYAKGFDKDKSVINKKMNVDIEEDKIKYLYKISDGISRVHGGKFVIQQIKENQI
jgi:hypothetical protein